jgi:catechol 2,3-dioxygenase
MSPNALPEHESEALPYGIAAPRYRLPAATHIGRVRLQVADLERSIRYYERVIGLRVLVREGSHAILSAAHDDRPLVALHERAGATPVPRRGRLGLYHFAILVPDRATLGRFLSHLESSGAYVGMSDHFVSEALYLTDPDGLGIEVYADRPRSEWRHADRQLQMTTVPLDAASVVGAAGGARWTGMPAGTVIGHVHLYVGHLDDAAAFYHQALGLDKVVWNYPGALFLSAGGYHHHLGTNTWAANAPSAGEGDARLIDWELLVPRTADAESAAQSLTDSGYSVLREGDADGSSWLVADPWGTNVRLRAER